MTTLAPTECALLGATHPHSAMHLGTLLLLPEVDRIWIWDADRAAAERLAATAGDRAAAASELDALLARPQVGFVLVARRHAETPATVALAARAGKPVLCEKPGARTAAEWLPALAAAREAGVLLGFCYPWRLHPVVRQAREWLACGLFGRVLSVEARMITSQVRFRDPSHWLFSREQAGGGILHWLGCHLLDALRFLLDDEVESVAALTARGNPEPIEVEDTAALALAFHSGALGTLHAGYLLPRSAPGYRGATYDTFLAVRGTLGRFHWQASAPQQVLHAESIHPDWVGAPERRLTVDLEPSDAYGGRHGLELVRRFLLAAQRGGSPDATGEDALHVLAILDAAYESAATGARVRVEPVAATNRPRRASNR